jgi:hypothetical protein
MRQRRRAVTLMSVVLISTTAMSLAACSSSSAGGTKPSGSSTESAGLKAAKAFVAEYDKVPTDIGVSQPLGGNVASLRGKTIVWMEPGVPVGAAQAPPMKAAATALGMNFKTINLGATPDTVTAGFNALISMNPLPAAVLTSGYDTTMYSAQLKVLEAHKIPLVAWGVSETTGEDDIVANLIPAQDQALHGETLADWAIADSEGKGSVVFFKDPDFNFFQPFVAAYQKAFSDNCPACAMAMQNVDTTAIGTTMPSIVVSYLQAHPQTKYVEMEFGDMMIGVPAALKAAGITGVKTSETSGFTTNFQYIDADEQTMDVGLPLGLLAWKGVDTAARAILGESVAPDLANTLPQQILTKADLTWNINQPWPGVPNYQAQFEKLWGVP